MIPICITFQIDNKHKYCTTVTSIEHTNINTQKKLYLPVVRLPYDTIFVIHYCILHLHMGLEMELGVLVLRLNKQLELDIL